MSIPLYYMVNSSDTVDLRDDVEDGEGEYTEALRREYTPPEVMDLDIPSNKPKQAKKLPKQPQKYVPMCLNLIAGYLAMEFLFLHYHET
jgi:hypothetical protein